MKNQLTFLIGALIVLALLAKMFTFVVRYDQVAVVTTFDSANADSIRQDPGLYFKLPWPIQDVTDYSALTQLLEDEPEELQTQDNFTVVVSSYVAWRIDDPLQFFKQIEDPTEVDNFLKPLLRDIRGRVISGRTFRELVNVDPEKVKLDEIEQAIRENLADEVAAQKWGVSIEDVGLRRIVLSEKITTQVFERMKSERETLASQIVAAGEAEASDIRSDANATYQRIVTFAEGAAQEIRARGEREAAQYVSVFAENEEFGIFLRRMEALEEILPNRTQFFIPLEDVLQAPESLTSPPIQPE